MHSCAIFRFIPAHAATRIIFFFFYGSGPYRDLHSFPTRRSSDLSPFPRPDSLFRHPAKPFAGSLAARQPKNLRKARSEEHTSELQSHVNLVCRLLLEKKKFVSFRYTLAKLAASLVRLTKRYVSTW